MAVFKNGYDGYEIDFSDQIAEKLENLWDTNRDMFEELTEHIYEQFDWVSGFHTDAPTLFSSFETREEAEKCDVALNRAIHKWFKNNDSNLKEIKVAKMVKIEGLVAEWIGYIDGFGNECAYTDSIIDQIKKLIKEL